MGKKTKVEKLFAVGKKAIKREPRNYALAIAANKFLIETTRHSAYEHPALKQAIDDLLDLANSDKFRNKIPVIAFALSRTGEWAVPGGRKRRGPKSKGKNAADPPKQISSGKMRKFVPDAEPIDLIEHGWRLVIRDLYKNGPDSKFLGISSPEAFIEAFTQKMVDREKALAQKHANTDTSRAVLENVDFISGTKGTAGYDSDNIIEPEFEQVVDTKLIFRKVEAVLKEHPQHYETTKRRFLEELTPAEESRAYGLPVEKIYARRDAAHKWLQDRLTHLKDD